MPGETTDSDTGKLTDAGLAKLYAAGISYSSYKADAAYENDRLKKIREANKSGKLLEGYASLQAQKDSESEIAKAAQQASTSVKEHADEISLQCCSIHISKKNQNIRRLYCLPQYFHMFVVQVSQLA